jgi:hypothetical protein
MTCQLCGSNDRLHEFEGSAGHEPPSTAVPGRSSRRYRLTRSPYVARGGRQPRYVEACFAAKSRLASNDLDPFDSRCQRPLASKKRIKNNLSILL